MRTRIVTIEDIQEIGDLLELVLGHPDIENSFADNGQEGLDLINSVVPELIILDIMLPGMSGWMVYDIVRAAPDLAHIPVIVLSVLGLPSERRQHFAHSSIDFYVQKPFDAVKMRRLIMRVLDRPDLWSVSGDDPAAYD